MSQCYLLHKGLNFIELEKGPGSEISGLTGDSSANWYQKNLPLKHPGGGGGTQNIALYYQIALRVCENEERSFTINIIHSLRVLTSGAAISSYMIQRSE